jgi:predicted signal transduction protein with EAL and GGDEF domain
VTPGDSLYVADRLRRAVASLEFRPNRDRHDLSVSVGGVVFNDAIPFSELFRAADANLYAAKDAGRNRSVITVFGDRHHAKATMRAAATGVTPQTVAVQTAQHLPVIGTEQLAMQANLQSPLPGEMPVAFPMARPPR